MCCFDLSSNGHLQPRRHDDPPPPPTNLSNNGWTTRIYYVLGVPMSMRIFCVFSRAQIHLVIHALSYTHVTRSYFFTHIYSNYLLAHTPTCFACKKLWFNLHMYCNMTKLSSHDRTTKPMNNHLVVFVGLIVVIYDPLLSVSACTRGSAATNLQKVVIACTCMYHHELCDGVRINRVWIVVDVRKFCYFLVDKMET